MKLLEVEYALIYEVNPAGVSLSLGLMGVRR
jgi:hypothetical protein